jgi:hypothetical protein
MNPTPNIPLGSDDLLGEIADTLGIPVSWFYEERAPPFASDAFDLIRLYAAISDEKGRKRAMDNITREATRCRTPKVP